MPRRFVPAFSLPAGLLTLFWLNCLLGPVRLVTAASGGEPVGFPGNTRFAPPSASAQPDPVRALRAANKQLSKTKDSNPAAKAAAHVQAGTALLSLHRYEQALRHSRQALKLGQQAGSPAGTAAAWQLHGRIRFAQGDTGHARQSYLAAFPYLNKLKSPAAQAQHYEYLADLYASQRAYAQALGCYQRAYGFWQQLNNPRSAIGALHAIGRMHLAQRSFSRALYSLRLGTEQAAALRDSVLVAYIMHSTGEVYATLGNHEVALGYYIRGLGQLPRRAAPTGLQATLHQAAATANQGMENWRGAEQHLRQAVPLLRRGRSKAWLSEIYQALSEVYRQQGNHAAALTALNSYVGLQDSVAAEQRAAQVAELRTRYETEKKEREIQLLIKKREVQEANLRRQKLVRNVLAAGTVLLLLAVAALYRGRKEQQRINALLEGKNAAISRQKEELDRLNRTKDTLFSVISHDLRSPLSSLYSLVTLLSMGSMPPEKLAAHSDRLTRTLDTTLRLLDNMLNWAATQMQGGGPRPEAFRLEAVAEECLALLIGDAERKNIEVLNHIRDASPARADLNMTRLVMRNLLSNAIKFTPSGGTITLSAQRQGPWWEVAVRDSGVGIAPADYDKIFGQAGYHTTLGTAREKGTGLGLRLCKDFVEHNGGTLTFTSQEGQGSVFRFTIQAAEPEVPAKASSPALLSAARASVAAE